MIPKYIKKQVDELMKQGLSHNELISEFKAIGKSKNAKDRTYITRMSNIKKYIKEQYSDTPLSVLKRIKAEDEVYDKISNLNDEQRARKDNVIITQQLLRHIEGLKDTNDFLERIIYALYVSGRRINEILNDDMSISKIRGKRGKRYVRFSHLSKQKAKEECDILLHDDITPTEFIKLVKAIRYIKNNLSLTIKDINKRVDKKLKNIDSQLSPHKLRGIYALVMYETSGKKQNINGFITDVLNHQSTDSSLNYSNYIMK